MLVVNRCIKSNETATLKYKFLHVNLATFYYTIYPLTTSISWVLKMHWKYMGNKTQRKAVFSTINIFAV